MMIRMSIAYHKSLSLLLCGCVCMCMPQVAVTFAVGSEVGLQSSSDFSQMGKPFLMGTVALGKSDL